MAQVINLREDEYQTIAAELSAIHAGQLQSVTDIIAQMKTLVTSNDTFSADLTSKKIEDMLDMLSGNVMTLLEQAFEDSETGVASMIKSIMAADSVCG